MTTLEIILITTFWIFYGVFNASQHDFYDDDYETQTFFVLANIVFAPIALIVRILRGIIVWKGEYK